MSDVTFRLDQTGLLVVDPYNDFISDGGKLWSRVREVVEANGCIPNMIRILEAARSAGGRIFFAPHHRWRAGDYETWKFWAPIQEAGARSKVFAEGTWGGTFRDSLRGREKSSLRSTGAPAALPTPTSISNSRSTAFIS